MPKDVARFIKDIERSERFADQVVHHEQLPGREAVFGRVSEAWPEPVETWLQGRSLHRLYSHQAKALDLIRSGRHTVISSPTASGKSLVYTLPVLESFLLKPKSRSLFLFPLKALAQDQLRAFAESLQSWSHPTRPRAEIYDGDTPKSERNRIRKDPPNILLTNPEMLHLSIMPHHHLWQEFLSGLDFVVLDEVHTYRGITGSNMAWVFRRLLRICRYYRADPIFIFCSATVGNPGELAHKLTGLKVESVEGNGSPRGKKHFLLLNPLTGPAQSGLALLQAALKRGLRTIVYSQSRKMTELIALWSAKQCPDYAKRISAYRSGFLPEERRDIEARLTDGRILAVITTSALELGIDIGSLDICILLGYPGSIMATWQRGGRVGRQQQESGVILLGMENSLDQYFMANPRALFQLQPENAVLNPFNPVIMQSQLKCAALDLPLDRQEDLLAGDAIQGVVDSLEEDGGLVPGESGQRLFCPWKDFARQVNLRGAGSQLSIVNESSRRSIGSIDFYRAHHETHPGAVYLHRGRTFVIKSLQPEQSRVWAEAKKVNYFTRVRSEKQTEILQQTAAAGVFQTRVCLGRLRITERITGYEKRLVKGQRLLEVVPLDLDPLIFETEGFWIEIPARIQNLVEEKRMHFMGGIHALEHALIGILPLLVLTDRRDLGGISHPAHPQLEQAAVFVYDGAPGGIGLCGQAFHRAEEMLERTLKSIGSCSCELGCPACIQSPKCGSGNRPLDKQSALYILHTLSGQAFSPDAVFTPAQNPDPAPEVACEIDSPGAAATSRDRPPSPAVIRQPLPGRFGVLDLETQLSAQEVGGWHRAWKMGVSCVVLYDSIEDDYQTYLEADLDKLIQDLQRLDLVVGFNIKRFDFQVLRGYREFPFQGLPCLDLLQSVHTRLGYRLSLDNLAGATLGAKKSASGLLALKWWKEGKMDKIIEYCRLDVALTRDLYLFGRDKGHVYFHNKARKLVRVNADW
ncbi:MAG: DEAD/DEAH box helicase [Desulfohalobiaceae bacterium]|nr:DEAD/DEAH box helicase [Desulfohalobiaceae bacterium]